MAIELTGAPCSATHRSDLCRVVQRSGWTSRRELRGSPIAFGLVHLGAGEQGMNKMALAQIRYH
ncbi:MAG TPA: hypothetical protein DDW52_24685 [Planctomycetaceae bacterium]|nr:hypothetical protein [Planctomycetaceae bacterium]